MYEELHRNKRRRTGIKRDVLTGGMLAEGRFRCTRVQARRDGLGEIFVTGFDGGQPNALSNER